MIVAVIYANYFCVRTQTVWLFSSFIVCIGSYLYILKQEKYESYYKYFGWFLRFVLIFSFPNLSDDIYRFFWDGKLSSLGINPFQYLPNEILQQFPEDLVLKQTYLKLNSPGYYSVYPPLCQYIFWGIVKWSDSIVLFSILLKFLFFIAEYITIEFIIKLLKKLNKPIHLVNWYIFNPLIIFELAGNCHFETLMITFLLISIYFLFEERLFLASLFFSLSFNIKLLPLIFIPIILKKIGVKRFIPFSITFISTLFLLNISLITPEIIFKIKESLDLYFQKFEYNAGIYYLCRFVGYKMYGFNTIQTLGPILSVATIGCISFIFFRFKYPYTNQDFIKNLFWIFLSYLIFSTTVHPWYLSLLILFGTLSTHSLPLIWSCVALFSYATYAYTPYQENLYIVFIEYFIVIGLIIKQLTTNSAKIKLN